VRHLMFLVAGLAALLLAGCPAPNPVDDDDDDDVDPLPEFTEDCDEAVNDSVADAAGIVAENRWEATGIQLCEGDLDFYRVDVPAGKWLSVRVGIAGSGAGGTDLDLYEVDAEGEEVWLSASEQDFERLAWFNPTGKPWTRYLRVEGYNDAEADYDLLVRRSGWHEGMDCDQHYPDEDPDDESGPCNRIMQFPQSNYDEDGYLVMHEAHYSNLRREVAYLVRWATAEVKAQYPDEGPLGTFDMSQWDGDTPGRMVGQLRHPEGTHVDGNDLDIAYYATNGDNTGTYACSSHDQYFCTGPADLLDVERTTFLISKLIESPMTRVMGIDPAVAEVVLPMAEELEDEGLIDNASQFDWKLAYGDGWPFHHHHIHFSWQWEDGYEGRGDTEGCLVDPATDPIAARLD
jgi:hypothetical protein